MAKKKNKLTINENHPVAQNPFRGSVCVWYETEEGRQLDYVVGPFTTDLGAYNWAENNRAKGRICTIELLIQPLTEMRKEEGEEK